MELILGVGGVGIAIALAVIGVGFLADERATIRSSLRRLDGFDIADTRDKELLAPLRSRAVAPVFKRILGFGRRVTPVDYVDRVRKKLVKAGRSESDALDRFLVIKIVCAVIAPFAVIGVLFFTDLGGLTRLLVAGLVGFALFVGPDAMLDRRVEERVKSVRVTLPEILDLLVISVEAGLGFEQALDRVVQSVPGPLTDEFSRMLGEVRAGASRADAMRAMEQRVDVAELRSFILAILQADTFGVSIGRILRAQADEMRIKRRQLAQEEAQKVPVKMLIPMVFCIFPALFVVVLGPAVINILDAF